MENKPKQRRIYQDSLSPEPRNWRAILKHLYTAEFKLVADKKIYELERRETFEYIDRDSANGQSLFLLWVFKYKLDSDSYFIKFKTRLYIYGDLQTTEQNIYTVILAVYIFRALIAIAAVFDLEFRQYDTVNIFVNSKINEEILCYIPEDYIRPKQY